MKPISVDAAAQITVTAVEDDNYYKDRAAGNVFWKDETSID